jgi:hypothetical protein
MVKSVSWPLKFAARFREKPEYIIMETTNIGKNTSK